MPEQPDETATDTEAEAPAAEPKSKGKAKAAPEPDPLAQSLDAATHEGLFGVALVFHQLELGFVHALAGAEDEAKAAIAAADAEVEKYAPHLNHLAREFELRKARIYAALKRK